MRTEFQVDLKDLHKGLDRLARKQLPFAMSLALTATAGRVGEAWQDEMRDELDRPTPFTLKSVGVRGARKTNLISTVFVKDIAANYLQPYVEGGPRFLGNKKGVLAPKAVPLNAYGNLPRRKLATLKGKSDVFVGPVKLRSGQVVSGVWQRNDRGRRRGRAGEYGTKGSHHLKHNAGMGLDERTTLKLLIRFSDPLPVKPRLDFRGRAEAAVHKYFAEEFAKALDHAVATAR